MKDSAPDGYKGEIADRARELGLQGEDIGLYRFMLMTQGLQEADDWAARTLAENNKKPRRTAKR